MSEELDTTEVVIPTPVAVSSYTDSEISSMSITDALGKFQEPVVEADDVDDDSDSVEIDTDTENTGIDPDQDTTIDTKSESDDSDDVDYSAEYSKLTSPFKANGKQVQVDNVDEARRLMQMGANYHSKMAALKPSRKILKLLENNDLLDESKINYLIDLSTKNPDAITKLLKDSNVDPTTIDMDTDTEYKPQSRAIGDNEIELDDILDSIKGTDTYDKTLSVVTETWDDASRSIISEHPHILGMINDQMSNGIYDQVTSIVDKQRQLGNLAGVSDIEAYKAIGDKLHAEGQLITQTTADPTLDAESPKKKPVKASTARRSKAAVKRVAPKKTNKAPINIYKLTDAEVAAMDSPPFKYV